MKAAGVVLVFFFFFQIYIFSFKEKFLNTWIKIKTLSSSFPQNSNFCAFTKPDQSKATFNTEDSGGASVFVEDEISCWGRAWIKTDKVFI